MKKDGPLAKNDDKNTDILDPHFQKIFNNKREDDWKVLKDISQRDTEQELDKYIEYSEFEEALDGLTNHKAPGEME